MIDEHKKRLIKLLHERKEFCMGADGFVYWGQGSFLWEAQHLRCIADELDQRNEEWQKKVDAASKKLQDSTDEEMKGSAVQSDSALPPVLDACCGSRMFWFDKRDPRGLFVDKRRESHTLPDISSKGGSRELVVNPDLQCDFTALPFPDASFALVVFDPPHFQRNGSSGWVGLKYGTLKGDWREMLRAGFAECFRVLKPEGTLIFKWCADEIPVSQILALTPERPLFGHKSGKQQKTHWITFFKQNA